MNRRKFFAFLAAAPVAVAVGAMLPAAYPAFRIGIREASGLVHFVTVPTRSWVRKVRTHAGGLYVFTADAREIFYIDQFGRVTRA